MTNPAFQLSSFKGTVVLVCNLNMAEQIIKVLDENEGRLEGEKTPIPSSLYSLNSQLRKHADGIQRFYDANQNNGEDNTIRVAETAAA